MRHRFDNRFGHGASSNRMLVATILLALQPMGLLFAQSSSVSTESSKTPLIVSLVDAAERKEWEVVREILQRAGDVQAKQVDGMTALHWAVWHDHEAMVEQLLEAGADASAANDYGVCPLAIACTNGNAKIASRLLRKGASPNSQLQGGETALMTAARTGQLDLVRALVDAGADVNAKERKGQTALMWAASEGHADVVRYLIERGADWKSEVSSGFDAFAFAARDGRAEVLQVLLAAGADPTKPLSGKKSGGKSPRNGTAPLILAVENGHFEVALQLIDAGADPNDQRTGFAPLHMLTWVRKPNRGDGDDGDPSPLGSGALNSLQFARELVARGAKVNARLEKGGSGKGVLTRQGATPFFMASMTDDVPYMKLLLELGADPTIPNADNATPLMAASGVGALAPEETAGTEEEALEAIELLLSLGADIHAEDRNGETAMHGAAYKNVPRVVKLLAARGAKKEVWSRENKYGWTPLEIAQGYRPGNFKPSHATEQAILEVMR